MAGYGQFCPVAQATELLAERWTLLVVRELIDGSTRFNEIRNGVPTMSPTLLAKRLRTLEGAGVVEHRDGGYHLTRAGRELEPLIEGLAVWGERWVRRTVSREDTDAALLMWTVRRCVRHEHTPDGRTTVHFRFRATPKPLRCWWLVLDGAPPDLCLRDPGWGVDITIHSDPCALTAVYMGDVPLAAALRRGAVRLEGPEHLVRGFPDWFGLSPFAGMERPRRAVTSAA
jgi:DNA-binding HxlR family transcriptional regulator